MNSEFQHAEAVAIIGGADGPSGVFVSENDIRQKTERYLSLLSVLSM